MNNGKGYHQKIVLAITNLLFLFPWFFACYVLTISPSSLWAAQDQFLGEKHKKTGIECQGCHQENTPGKPVLPSACLACHGDYTKIAAQTEKVDPNPHASHEGNLACGVCHNAHKPSKDHCATCHNFGFKVP
jgi:hypothetical protein